MTFSVFTNDRMETSLVEIEKHIGKEGREASLSERYTDNSLGAFSFQLPLVYFSSYAASISEQAFRFRNGY